MLQSAMTANIPQQRTFSILKINVSPDHLHGYDVKQSNHPSDLVRVVVQSESGQYTLP